MFREYAYFINQDGMPSPNKMVIISEDDSMTSPKAPWTKGNQRKKTINPKLKIKGKQKESQP